MDEGAFLERKVCLAAITSTEFLQQIYTIWDPSFLESPSASRLVGWCVDYFDSYHQSPGKDIEGIYIQKLKEGMDQDQAKWIEFTLSSLSEEQERSTEDTTLDFLLDQVFAYFESKQLENFLQDIRFELEKGGVEKAKELALSFQPIPRDDGTALDLIEGEKLKSRLKSAFEAKQEPLIRFPGALGKMWNHQMVRGALVGLMGREKIGKSFILIYIAMRALRQGSNVAFFQAGDMTEEQQLRRIAVYLAKRSDEERYCEGMYIPVKDCIWNLTGECELDVREDDDTIFGSEDELKELSLDILVDAFKSNPDHKTCRNCKRFRGAPWLSWWKGTQPLSWKDAYRQLRALKSKTKGRFFLSTHPNETLNLQLVKNLLGRWEKERGFKPDVIIIDYADILAPDLDTARLDFRQQQNKIWQRLRKLSQERDCLVLTATQIKAEGYKKTLLSMAEFSEDKRKFAHVTAMYGLNQTPEEKRIGIMRINELVVRDSDFEPNRPVTVLQRLQIGRPILETYR